MSDTLLMATEVEGGESAVADGEFFGRWWEDGLATCPCCSSIAI